MHEFLSVHFRLELRWTRHPANSPMQPQSFPLEGFLESSPMLTIFSCVLCHSLAVSDIITDSISDDITTARVCISDDITTARVSSRNFILGGSPQITWPNGHGEGRVDCNLWRGGGGGC